MERLKQFIEFCKQKVTEHGMFGFIYWFVIQAVMTLALFAAAELGFGEPSGNAGVVGRLFVAYLTQRALIPVRGVIFLVTIPFAVWIKDRIRPPTKEE